MTRKLPIGAEIQSDPPGVHFRVWAPASQTAKVELHSVGKPDGREILLAQESGGYFSVFAPEVRAGDLYKIRLDHGAFADPASRFQPEGPHGPSQIVDPTKFPWSDSTWRGPVLDQIVIYELHLGTFTPAGTWRAAMEQLPELKRIGITMLEIMPVAEFPGNFGWGYDGVDIFAPYHGYGSPDDARAFINRAHEVGLAVILDVVYNHLGPDGNYVSQFSRDYFNHAYKCEWGDAMNFDGANAGPVREFFITNARYWIGEFHFDGLRLDATQQIFDKSELHVLTEISRAARAAAGERTIYLVAENEVQHARLVRPFDVGGHNFNAIWNDDFHHSALVAATGKAEAYFCDYRGHPQEFISALKRGFLFQGQWYRWQQKRRGELAFDLTPRHFVTFLQNHDQVSNSIRGWRLHQSTSPAQFRALTALLLLSPSTPMLFQGDEFSASAPFVYFADHPEGLRAAVSKGRGDFLRQFPSIASEENRALFPEPESAASFQRCKLDFSERKKNAASYRLHQDLLRIRHAEKTLTHPDDFDGAVLGTEAFVLRFFSAAGDDRLLLVNLGNDTLLHAVPEPLLAPTEYHGWRVEWSSEAPEYGGGGTPTVETSSGWRLPARSTLLLRPDENTRLLPAKLSEKD